MESFDLNIEGSKFTRTQIYQAIKEQNSKKVLKAIQAGDNVHHLDHDFGTTYLHFVASQANSTNEEKFVPMVYQLSNAGIDVNAKDYKNRTALELATYRELKELMVALIRVGVDPTDKPYKAIIREGGSPFEYELIDTLDKYEPGLWSSVMNNDTSMVFMLVQSWCRINIYRFGRTLIEYAHQTNKHPDLIQVLDDYEVTLEFVHATLAGDEKRMLEFLMDSKPCDASIMDISYQERWSQPLTPRSLRHTAIDMGHKHVLHLLPEEEEVEKQVEAVREESANHEDKQEEDIYIDQDSLPDVTTTSNDTYFCTNQEVRFEHGEAFYAPQEDINDLAIPLNAPTLGEEEDEDGGDWLNFHEDSSPANFRDGIQQDFASVNFHGSLRNRFDLKHSTKTIQDDYAKNWQMKPPPPPVPPPRRYKKKRQPPPPPPITPRKTKPMTYQPVTPSDNNNKLLLPVPNGNAMPRKSILKKYSVDEEVPTPRKSKYGAAGTATARLRNSIKSKTCAIS